MNPSILSQTLSVRFTTLASLVAFPLLGMGCSIDATDSPTVDNGNGVGGTVMVTTGGTLGAGGTVLGTGGAPATGGTSPAAGGTVFSTGGALGVGGGVGGVPATGGVPAAGGTPGTGGTIDGVGGVPGSGGTTEDPACDTEEEEKFSFFATSRAALIELSGNQDGFGGDLRYPNGETDGLKGADNICQAIAEMSSECQSSKVWHAFLSTSTVHAIDRVGTGPWHDRLGRLLASDLNQLVKDRPGDADQEIKNDFPNEDGVPNQYPDGQAVDNHQFITGSGLDGRLYAMDNGAGSGCTGEQWSIANATCNDWTSKAESGCPRVGHSWPRDISGTNWMSVWNEGGCAPGGVLTDGDPSNPFGGGGGPDGSKRIGSAGGYGGFYCFADNSQ